MTESHEIQQKAEENTLTDRQRMAIPAFLAAPTITAGCEAAGVDRSTWYQWLSEPAFKTELERQRSELTAEAFATLSQSLTRAVEALVGLLDDSDKRIKRLAAKDVIGLFIQCHEMADLEKRVAEIERRVEK